MDCGTTESSESATRQVPAEGTASAEEAAAALGTELVRMTRLIAAWKQRAKTEAGAADRVLLARLVTDGPQRATDLAAAAYLDLSTVSRQVRSLVERGLVERHPDAEDRRGSLLSATGAGRERFEQYRSQRDTELTKFLQAWPGEDRYQLMRLLARLTDDLVKHQPLQRAAGRHSDSAAQQGESTNE
ncbi:MarR family winged helix-turn-helix transcriptional regulator [Streptomyces sp. NBC_01387]|uniref:MarR family winged helix-turn-helix transcriptional regulator n=1 Tax=unclassified Streptomyces TaxID=2593676 RepID=UPI0020248309|nr:MULTISPECIES: MarR family winged helix-turn-helix transcriptional regulator [unclassified Streptomyces]WSC21862.1 MarR family winged helix-turn-helix transcriptional regulator [Streptomyces sp. NBC_01766]WSV55817.1 MarR family winged helix-turn-helix transcriptional regulator [Streptomyces sp. NBC_01014]